MLAVIPVDITDAIVGALALADRCALAATCKALRDQSATWFLQDTFDLPADEASDNEGAPRPTPAWLRRHGSSVTLEVQGSEAVVARQLQDLAGARVTGIRTVTFPHTVIPAETLAPFVHTLTSLHCRALGSYSHLTVLTNLVTLDILPDLGKLLPIGDLGVIGAMTSLKKLRFSPEEPHIPSFVPNLTNLTSLEMFCYYEPLKPATWDRLGGLAKLQDLEIFGAAVDFRLPPPLARLTALTRLTLYAPQDHLEEWDVTRYAEQPTQNDLRWTEVLGALHNLKSLHLLYYHLDAVPPALPPSLTKLVIRNQGYNCDGRLEALATLVDLRELQLWSMDIRRLPPTLSTLTALTALDLYDNTIDVDTPFPFPQLLELSLANNADFMDAVPPALAGLTRLRNLVANRVNFEEGWGHLPESLERASVNWSEALPGHISRTFQDPRHFISLD